MRLKKYLFESSEKRARAERLDHYLQTKFKNDSRVLLYRGTSTEVDDWQEKKIRKDREPKDTRVAIHHIVDAISENYYPGFPKRSESKYASTSDYKSSLKDYGPNIYIVFPEKDADIVSWEHDTYKFLNNAGIKISNYNKLEPLSEVLMEEGFENLSKFLKLYYLKQHQNMRGVEDRLKEVVGNSWNEIKTELKTAYKKGAAEDFRLAPVLDGIESIEKYFERGMVGIHQGTFEIMFNGSEYLVVEESFFEEHFVWRGQWQIKERD